MARSLNTLVKVRAWDVDGKRRALGVLLRRLDDLEASAIALEAGLRDEQRIAADSPGEAGFLYGAYARAVIERRETLARAVVQVEAEIAVAREELREAYRELKKFEVTRDNRLEREARERNRVEQIELDEIAIEGHRRKTRLQRPGSRGGG